ncbi:MAG: T9SS type A sorting domain-containing protein, partial [Algoriphagus sp.]|uniref:T9SS type A sorting domain-containing protein n=1 Tax=Algoriphagus sp. TaxID=1872435 RepID=UPI002638166F
VSGAEGSIRWEYSTDGISYYDAPYWRTSRGVNTIFVNPNNTVEFTTQSRMNGRSYAFTSLNTDVYFRARVLNEAGLSTYTDPVYYQIVSAGTITGGDVTVCAPLAVGPDNTLTSPITNVTVLTLSNAVGAVIEWQKSTDYSVGPSAAPVWTAVKDLSAATAVGASYSGAGSGVLVVGNLSSDTWYRAVVKEGGCIATSAVVKITVDQASLACVNSSSAFRVLETLPVSGNQAAAVAAVETSRVEVEWKEGYEVVAYPNPTRGRFMLDLSGFEAGSLEVKVMESTGRLLHEQEYELAKGRTTIAVNPMDRAAGVYFVQVIQGPRMKMIRMIFE